MRALFSQKSLLGVVCSFHCTLLLCCMYGRTVGIFKQAIFRSSLVNSDSRTAEAEVVRGERTGQRHL